jgi:hypothetical protein
LALEKADREFGYSLTLAAFGTFFRWEHRDLAMVAPSLAGEITARCA